MRRDEPEAGHDLEPVVEGVGHHQGAVGADRAVVWEVELSRSCIAVAKAPSRAARHRGDGVVGGGLDSPDAVVDAVHDHDHPRAVDRHPRGVVALGRGTRAVGVTQRSGSCPRGDCAVGRRGVVPSSCFSMVFFRFLHFPVASHPLPSAAVVLPYPESLILIPYP